MRLLRSVPQLTLSDAAVSLGEPVGDLIAHLGTVNTRGVCAAAAAAAALSERSRGNVRHVMGDTWEALSAAQPQITTRTLRRFPVPTAHRMCPPPAVRAAAADTGTRPDPLPAAGFAGTAGWTGREARRLSAPRRVRTIAVRGGALADVVTLASSSSTPPALLGAVADGAWKVVDMALVSNSSCPPQTLAQLSTQPESRIRCAVALNRSTPLPVVAALVGDPSVEVAKLVRKTLTRRHRKHRPISRRIRLARWWTASLLRRSRSGRGDQPARSNIHPLSPANPEAATTASRTPCSPQPSSQPSTTQTPAPTTSANAQKANATTPPSSASPDAAATSSSPCSKPKPPTNQPNPCPKPPRKT